MKQVSFASIEKAIQLVDNLDDEGLEALSNRYASAQPVLLNYIMTAPQEYENEDLGGILIYYFCLLIACFEEEGLELKPITDEQIDQFEEPYFALLDQYFETEEEELLEDFFDQPELTRFMAMEISTDDQDGSSFNDETATQLFIVSLAMIGLLSKSTESAE